MELSVKEIQPTKCEPATNNEAPKSQLATSNTGTGFLLSDIQGEEALNLATKIAQVLTNVIESRKLYEVINGKKYVRVDGWAALGGMVGIFGRVTEIQEKEIGNKYEVIAKAEAIAVRTGSVISTAYSGCSNSERNWQGRDKYAIRSMAQTRALGKVLKLCLSWVMTLAGYETTPAEEMIANNEPQPKKIITTTKKATPTTTSSLNKELLEHLNLLKRKIWTDEIIANEDLKKILIKLTGKQSFKQVTNEELSKVIKELEQIDDQTFKQAQILLLENPEKEKILQEIEKLGYGSWSEMPLALREKFYHQFRQKEVTNNA
jgi:hypothetical protein